VSCFLAAYFGVIVAAVTMVSVMIVVDATGVWWQRMRSRRRR
jgi:hypothetical protein